jgi:hypothetical protein
MLCLSVVDGTSVLRLARLPWTWRFSVDKYLSRRGKLLIRRRWPYANTRLRGLGNYGFDLCLDRVSDKALFVGFIMHIL